LAQPPINTEGMAPLPQPTTKLTVETPKQGVNHAATLHQSALNAALRRQHKPT